MNATLEAMVKSQQVQNKMANNGQVGGTLAFTCSMLVFTKGDVQHPMQLVFNGPVTTDIG